MSPWIFYLAGTVLAFLVLIFVQRGKRSPVPALAVVLVVAALIYVGFALSVGASLGSLALELVGVVLYGSLAWAGIRYSPWWLAAGWALHTVWDIGLHLVGPAAGIAPEWYAHVCLAFDLVVAGALALQILRQRANNSSKPTPFRGAA